MAACSLGALATVKSAALSLITLALLIVSS
jgi:hypothetical protein